nr:hypothetical protein [uncultured Rhodopila sp.]
MTTHEFVEVCRRCRESRVGYRIGAIKITIDTIADLAPPVTVHVGNKFVCQRATIEDALGDCAAFLEEEMKRVVLCQLNPPTPTPITL